MINAQVLMSGTQFFGDELAINPYMDATVSIDRKKAAHEHAAIRQAFEEAGIRVIRVQPPADCQDGVYTANWALIRDKKAVLSSLPGPRQGEQAYAKNVLQEHGFSVIQAPARFSGQGDALPCGDYLLAGSHYRTDSSVHQFLADQLGYKVISLQTVPQLNSQQQPQINPVSGWPDSLFYDIDLALAVLSNKLIAWCPEAFVPESRQKIASLPLDKIEVSYQEATQGFACNLVSTGTTVIMSSRAPQLQKAIEQHGLRTLTPAVSELAKGGGYIRCVSLSLSN